MLVVGVVDGQGTVQSPGLSSSVEKRMKVEDKASTSKSVKCTEKPAKSSEHQPTKSSTDARFDELNQKWSGWFNRLEVLLLARTLDKPQELTFQTVKVVPSHTPLTDVGKNKEPFIRPTTPPLLKPADRLTTDPATTKQQAASLS